jgi:hypothetical protein
LFEIEGDATQQTQQTALHVAGFQLENGLSRAHNQAMELIISKVIGFLVAVCTATTVALIVWDIGHNLGFSSLDIRMAALIGVVVVATLLASEYFERLQKPK